MVGSGSKVTVTVELKTVRTGTAATYIIISSSPSVKCGDVTIAEGAKKATATCEVDMGCEIGAYKLTVTAPLSDSKTSAEYHVVSAYCSNS